MKIKLNVALKGFKADDIINIEDIDGVPKERFWRDRLKDSAIDNCIEIIKENKKGVKK